MKHVLPVFLILAVLILMCCSCGSEQTHESLIIIHSGNIGGKFDACGCSPPMGGMARRETVVKAIAKNYTNILTLDSGALMYVVNFLMPPTDTLYRFDANATSVLAERVGFDAVNVSSFDLCNSVDSLLAVDSRTSFPMLSANLVWRKDDQLVFEPDQVFTKGALKVGVFGVMSDNYLGTPLFNDPSPVKVLDINEAAKKEVAKLKKGCDVVIGLAYMSEDEMKEMIETVPGMDVVIHSHNNYHTPSADHMSNEPVKIGKTLLLRCPDGGRVIGVAELHVVNGKADFVKDESDVVYNEENAKSLKSSVFRHYFFDMGPEVREDPDIQKEIDSINNERNALKAHLGLKR